MPRRLVCRELRNLAKSPTRLKSVNFRRTTPGSAVILVTKHAPQPTSDLLDPTYPGAHLPLKQRLSLTPRWMSPHLTLCAFPKAFLSKPEMRFREPYKPRPYPAPPQSSTTGPEHRSSADMSMQIIPLNSRVVTSPTVRVNIKRRIREAVRLIVTRGAGVNASREGLKVVFHASDIGADKWIVPDWTYVALPTSEMFRMPFAELLKSMRQALVYLHRAIPEAEKALKSSARENEGVTSSLDKKAGLKDEGQGSTLRAPSKGKLKPTPSQSKKVGLKNEGQGSTLRAPSEGKFILTPSQNLFAALQTPQERYHRK